MNASSANLVATGNLAPGTELIVDRLAYRHHGIYLGDGLVIHYAGRISHPHGLIETIPLRAFAGRRRVRVGRAPGESLRGQDIVRRARSRLGERHYDVFRNNCEHFCSWCQVGESRSKQVDVLLRPIQSLSCAVRSMLSRRDRNGLKRRPRNIAGLNLAVAKHLPRSLVKLPAPAAWESQAAR